MLPGAPPGAGRRLRRIGRIVVRILLTGAGGQLGQALRGPLAALGEVAAADRSTCDVCDEPGLARLVREIRPSVIVNAAAWTDVDGAESRREQADAVNAQAPGVLARLAREHGALLVHYSTDYVFDGRLRQPYRETDTPAPLSAYGAGKLAGEAAVRAAGGAHAIVRTGWLYGRHGRNFVATILALARERAWLDVVDDQFGSPTPADWLAQASATIAGQYLAAPGTFPSGTYHLCGQGVVSRHAWAQAIVRAATAQGAHLALAPERIRAVPTGAVAVRARRPAWSALDSSLAAGVFGLTPPPWDGDIARVVAARLQG